MVDLKHTQSRRQVRIAMREGVQARAQEHVLSHPAGHRLIQGIFGEATARHQETAQVARVEAIVAYLGGAYASGGLGSSSSSAIGSSNTRGRSRI